MYTWLGSARKILSLVAVVMPPVSLGLTMPYRAPSRAALNMVVYTVKT